MQSFIDLYIDQGRQQGWFAGRQEGELSGLLRGRQEGRKEGLREMLLRLMARKFGPLTDRQRQLIEQATAETLLYWSEQMLAAESAEEILR